MKTIFRKINPRGMVILFMIFQWFFFLPAYILTPECGSFPLGPHAREVIEADNIKPLPNYKQAFEEAMQKDNEESNRKGSIKLMFILIINILIDIGVIYSCWNLRKRKQTEQGRSTIPTGALR